MSGRNIRKLYGNNTLPPPEDNSDDEYEPLYAKKSSEHKYKGLILSSDSNSDLESNETAVEKEVPVEVVKTKGKKKKKHRKVKHVPKAVLVDDMLDEIDKSVLEVNAILGTPPEASIGAESPPADPALDLLAVQQKHLIVANELKKLFGPEDNEQGNRRRGRQPNLNRLLKKVFIVPTDDIPLSFQKSGLGMSINRRENGITYFTYDHNREYQQMHRVFLQLFNYRTNNVIVSIEEAQRNMHLEGLLEGADAMFRLEEYTVANTLVERVISYMQYNSHPLFNLTDGKIRLEYKYLENRPFHIAVLKYLHLLTNRACHRTALELAKLLLNLDPSDPLAVLFIIDTLALRAREHQWLIDAVDYWSKERDAGFLFNIQYSYAMSQFHVTHKNKGDVTNADQLLQNAMMRFPTVVMKIFECANLTPSPRLQSHALFNSAADEATSKNLKDLIFLYAKFTWSKWREPAVLQWLTRNANELADKYDKDPQMQARAKELTNERYNLFQGWPEEVVRHLSIIKPMANLLVDGAVPRVNRTRAFDPVPPANGVNRCGYDLDVASPTVAHSHSVLYELFTSILPHYGVELERQVLERRHEAIDLDGLQENQNHDEIEQAIEVDLDDALINLDNNLGHDNEPRDDPGNFVMSLGALANAVRRFMDIYETGNDPEENEQNDQRPEEERQDGNQNPQNEN